MPCLALFRKYQNSPATTNPDPHHQPRSPHQPATAATNPRQQSLKKILKFSRP
ncbi:MAG: hypothetical protein LUD39_04675 [Opitutae bacterium]|nr:hypothetical protein [Opitutae bacterium]